MKPIDISSLSIEQKIGQMLVMRNPIHQEDFDYVRSMIKDHALGAIHVSYKYVHDGYYVDSEKVILDMVQNTADYPILICEDMEYGYPFSEVAMPYQIAIGSADDEELAYQYGRITAIEAKRAGYNTVFGPIVDIAMNPEASCVGSRAYGGNKEIVARMAAATIRGYQDQGMIVTAKHYPGFGASSLDAHIQLVELSGGAEELLDRELYPYLYTMKHADLSGIMTGHIMVPKIDAKYPATISPKLVKLLRSTGYDGLIMTDSFAMVGMTSRFPIRDCHKLAMAAGNDMIMTSYRSSMKEAYGAMLEAYQEGMVTEEQINAAVERVIRAQNRTLKKAEQNMLTQSEFDAADRMGKKAVAAKCMSGISPSIDKAVNHLFIIQEGNLYKDVVSGIVKQDICNVAEVTKILKEKFVNSDFIAIPEFPVRAQLEHIMVTSLGYDSCVLVLANRSIAYGGSSDATKRMLAVINGLRHKLEAILLFGNPYAAREFGEIPRIIFGFDGGACQKYAALTLAGEHEPVGKIPVNLP